MSQKNYKSDLVNHEKYMMLAIENGELGKFTSHPNPWVGSVIVSKNNVVIGVGHHHKTGTAHAEIVAINDCIKKGMEKEIEGSTIYVTLEPCSHYGRTGPCAKKLIEYKFAKVVIALGDPDEKVNGSGVNMLLSAGITVIRDVCAREAYKSLEAYIYQRKTGLPFVVAKIAQSIDGKICCKDYTSQWITGELSRNHANRNLRAISGAVIVGSTTFIKDKPRLNVRDEVIIKDPQFVQPLKVIIDRRGRLGEEAGLDLSNCVIFTENNEFRVGNASKIYFNSKIDLDFVLKTLGDMGIIQVLVEGGAELLTAFIEEKKVNKLVIYTGSTILGSSAKSSITKEIADTITNAVNFNLESCQVIQNDVMCVYSSKEFFC